MSDTHIITDIATSAKMAGVRREHTKPELALRKALFKRGFRYRLHPRKLPGRPDIAFPKYRTALFVHGCYWHRHEGCRFATTPKRNRHYWTKKFNENVRRDQRKIEQLESLGWKTMVAWECEIKNNLDYVVHMVISDLLRDI